MWEDDDKKVRNQPTTTTSIKHKSTIVSTTTTTEEETSHSHMNHRILCTLADLYDEKQSVAFAMQDDASHTITHPHNHSVRFVE